MKRKMKRKYIEPEQIFVKFNVRDIVITSGREESVSSDVTVEDAEDLVE